MKVYRNEYLRETHCLGEWTDSGWIPLDELYNTRELAEKCCPRNKSFLGERIYYRTVEVDVIEEAKS